jgi:flagellar biosynthesis chaperone FliJ
MMIQMAARQNPATELKKLSKKRDQLRDKLREHFSQPVSQRDYKAFEIVVDELDQVRKKIQGLKR